MNIQHVRHHNLRAKLGRFASPPEQPEASLAGEPVAGRDQVTLSEQAKCPPKSASFLSKGASAVALGFSIFQALAPGGAQAMGASNSPAQESVIDALVRQVLEESDLQSNRLSNPRFSSFPQLSELGAQQALGKGEEGPHIEAVQNALVDMGFGIPAGATGGFYGQTQRALNNFRASVNMEASSVLDQATLRRLDQLAPPPGRTLSEHPTASFPQAQYVNGELVRVVVNLDEHRLFFYDTDGSPEAVFPMAKGASTQTGLKVVNYKYSDPREVSDKFWPDAGGRAFGTRLIDLKWLDPQTGETRSTDEEIHGTFQRGSIGGNGSSGCVRLFNEDVESLYSQLTAGDLVVFQ